MTLLVHICVYVFLGEQDVVDEEVSIDNIHDYITCYKYKFIMLCH